MRTGPTQLQKQPTRLKYRPFYSTLLKIDSVQKKEKKNDKREEILCKIQALSKSRVRVTGDTAWVVQPSMSKSIEQGYGIMITIINYILKEMTVIHHS